MSLTPNVRPLGKIALYAGLPAVGIAASTFAGLVPGRDTTSGKSTPALVGTTGLEAMAAGAGGTFVGTMIGMDTRMGGPAGAALGAAVGLSSVLAYRLANQLAYGN